jgi:hypothetical protein
MDALIAVGQLMPLDELARELTHRIEARGLGPPRSFVRLAEQILVDHPECKGLVLAGNTALPGSIEISQADLLESGITAIAVLGDFTVQERLLNSGNEIGPFLFVDGDLNAGQIEKGGASFVVLGSVNCRGVIFCDDTPAVFLVGGDISAHALITCDQEVYAGGEIRAPIVSDELGNNREMLVPEVFEDPDDPDDEFVNGDLMRARLEAGLPVLKG